MASTKIVKKPSCESVTKMAKARSTSCLALTDKKTDKKNDAPNMSEEDAEALVANPAERRKAYGKLTTAIKQNQMNPNGDNVVKLWDGLEKCPVDRDRKKREFLKAWLMDPTFTEGIAHCTVYISHITETEELGKPVTRTQLDRLVGEKDAQELIDNKKLEETKNRYGQDCWVYHEDTVRNLRMGGWKVQVRQEMKLDAEQHKSLISNLVQAMPSEHVGGSPVRGSKARGKKPKGKDPEDPPVDPAVAAAKERKRKILAADKGLTQLKYKAVPLNAAMKKSKHKFASRLVKTSDASIGSCATHRQHLEYLLHTEDAPEKKFDSIMKGVGTLTKKLADDIAMMEALPGN